jgi:hypothetical protein
VGVRLNPTSGVIEVVEINFFSQQLAETGSLEIPIGATLRFL